MQGLLCYNVKIIVGVDGLAAALTAANGLSFTTVSSLRYLGDPKNPQNEWDAREVVPYNIMESGGSICKNSAVLFTFITIYVII